MDDKILICVFLALLEIAPYECDVINIDSMEAEIEDGGTSYKTKLASCKINPKDFEGYSITGQKGEKGDRGFYAKGEPGRPGPQGPQGLQGLQGPKGDPGERGQRGEPGRNGAQGLPGSVGKKGIPGDVGDPGEKGERGSIGISGVPGLDGTCNHICPPPSREPTRSAPEGKKGEGTKYEPSNGLCNMKRDKTIVFKDKIWVFPEYPFEVNCIKTSHLTCIDVKKPTEKFDGRGAFIVNETRPFWLSERHYNIADLYGIPFERLKWLHQRATKVTQTIRYHCKNSYVADQPETALLLYGWNDITIGPNTDFSPLIYSPTRGNHNCTADAPKTEWRYSDIKINSNMASRLPVIDFRIRDIRKGEDQRFYLELVELCFG